MDELTPEQLLDKYFNGTCTEEEKATLETWYLLETENATDLLSEPAYDQLEAAMWQAINPVVVSGKKSFKLWYRIVAAAAAILFVGGIGLFYAQQRTGKVQQHLVYLNIKSGGNKAYLTLANGQKISLADAVNGQLAEQDGVEITKTADGKVSYQIRSKTDQRSAAGMKNTIETPRGGQYQVLLPDGSKVWLNAASKLSYPISFAEQAERKIELSGEAYFEIYKDKKHPFIVHTAQQEVKVLGTHFNVRAYQEEQAIKTTLLEGSVKISGEAGAKILRPGEQAELSAGNIAVKKVEAQDAIAWKDGYFMFNYENLETVMQEVSRWYNVKLKYEDDAVRKEVFFGTISKFENISKVLNMLERTGVVKFRMNDRTIIISRK